MAPFPEAEDMTIKRLYVALKRNDVQLLQMGAHKLHEKFHTGHKFELLDDLKQILTYIEAENSFVPVDVKDLLTKTINDILNGKIHENANNNESFSDDENQIQKNENFIQAQVQENEPENVIFTPKETDSAAYENVQDEKNQTTDYLNIIEEYSAPDSEIQTVQTTLDFNQEQTIQQTDDFAQKKPVPVQVIHPDETNEMPDETKTDIESVQNIESQTGMNIAQDNYVQNNETQLNAASTHSGENHADDNSIKNEVSQNNEVQPDINAINAGSEQNNEIQIAAEENIPEEKSVEYTFVEKEPCLDNVAVFYDDKASFIDYVKNKQYRSEFNAFSLGKDVSPLENAAAVKNIADIPTDEIGEILKMLNMIKGNVYFITTSKSENIIKNFIENGVNFQIPLVTKQEIEGKKTVLVPLFGLSNIFLCPKCNEREYFGGFHNKVLSLQCKNCGAPMYPDIYEAENYETNANPYYWVNAINSMAHADIWILINPPLENTRILTAEFIKTSFEAVKPKKVYILSKETTKREYYKQIFAKISPNCDIKADFQSQDILCEDFINCEMSAVKVST